ncbi:hypothetical protein [Allomuricauda sp. SCSIO 65647]|uniref:hypothetical protein n=1 Tax=Allomuricauda sp. SCSIO 65647 TaxID=2908843 RepID=UPI001F2AB90B|nr:hypothetical protein [Muricauda sp. SCSIO 65647]UJH67199.1 hypothetical protein L0P89_14760 [Muricauda sp. SCSIO 65647]
MIITNNLTKKYGGQMALDHLNLNVKESNIYCLLGANGAGMTIGIIEEYTYFQINSSDSFDLVEKQDYGDGKGFVTILEVKYKRIGKK